MLKINKLSHCYGQQEVLKQIDLDINQPGLYVLAGINGCGKSTLFNCICGFLPIQQGYIEVNGTSCSDEYRVQLGIITEPFNTQPNLTVKQIINICRRIKNANEKECQYWLEFWQMTQQQDKPFKALSVGMRKRLAITTSLIGNSDFLFWDEPFNGLDPLGMQKLRELIKQLIRQGKTILLSTHILGEIDIKEATILIMKEGRIMKAIDQTNSKEEILEILH